MLNLKSITSALTGRTETTKANENLKVLSPEVFRRKQMYDTVMNTVQHVGGETVLLHSFGTSGNRQQISAPG